MSLPKEITVTDCTTAYALLATDPSLYLTAPPMPASRATQYGLTQRLAVKATPYRDLLIRHKDYRLTSTDEILMRAIKETVHTLK